MDGGTELSSLSLDRPVCIHYLGGGFKYFLFSPLPGEMILFDEYFFNGLKPPTRLFVHVAKEFIY